jgi:hypothetical protein
MHFHHSWHRFIIELGVIAAVTVVYLIARACRKPESGDGK